MNCKFFSYPKYPPIFSDIKFIMSISVWHSLPPSCPSTTFYCVPGRFSPFLNKISLHLHFGLSFWLFSFSAICRFLCFTHTSLCSASGLCLCAKLTTTKLLRRWSTFFKQKRFTFCSLSFSPYIHSPHIQQRNNFHIIPFGGYRIFSLVFGLMFVYLFMQRMWALSQWKLLKNVLKLIFLR